MLREKGNVPASRAGWAAMERSGGGEIRRRQHRLTAWMPTTRATKAASGGLRASRFWPERSGGGTLRTGTTVTTSTHRCGRHAAHALKTGITFLKPKIWLISSLKLMKEKIKRQEQLYSKKKKKGLAFSLDICSFHIISLHSQKIFHRDTNIKMTSYDNILKKSNC